MMPMLEFTNLPPRAEERPKRRRRKKITSPENPRVRCVALAGLFNRPNGASPDGAEDGGQRDAYIGAKWVSPQFPDLPDPAAPRGSRGHRKTRRRVSRPTLSLRNQPPAPTQTAPGFNSRRGRQGRGSGGSAMGDGLGEKASHVDETGCARARGWRGRGGSAGSCARTRVWSAAGLTHSQDISVWPSVYTVRSQRSQRSEQQDQSSPVGGTGMVMETEGCSPARMESHVDKDENGFNNSPRDVTKGQSAVLTPPTSHTPPDQQWQGATVTTPTNHTPPTNGQGASMAGSPDCTGGGHDEETDFIPLPFSDRTDSETMNTRGQSAETGYLAEDQCPPNQNYVQLDNLSDLFSSMSVDSDHAHQSAKLGNTRPCSPEDSNHTHNLPTDSDNTCLPVDPDPAHLPADFDLTRSPVAPADSTTHLPVDSDPTHLSVFEIQARHPSPVSVPDEGQSAKCRGGGRGSDCDGEVSRGVGTGGGGGSADFDSDATDLSVCEVMVGVAGQPTEGEGGGGGRRGEESVARVCGDACNISSCSCLEHFKPSSCSTPCRENEAHGKIDQSELSRTGDSPMRNWSRSDSDSANMEWSLDRNPTRRAHSSATEPGSDGAVTGMECTTSSNSMHTDMESERASKVPSPSVASSDSDLIWRAVFTPRKDLRQGIEQSVKKSILKKRPCDGNSTTDNTHPVRKNLSKSVTFKLPFDSPSVHTDESGRVLADETPQHLWCSPAARGEGREGVASITGSGGERVSETLAEGEYQWSCLSQWRCSVMRDDDDDDAPSSERSSVLAREMMDSDWSSPSPQPPACAESDSLSSSSVLVKETPEHLWCSLDQRNAAPVPSGDLVTVCSSSSSSSESVLAEETPEHLWCSLVTRRTGGSGLPIRHLPCVLADVSMCSVVGESRVGSEVVPDSVEEEAHGPAVSCSLECEAMSVLLEGTPESMSVLAYETPVHLWMSPPVKVIDNTFD